MKTPVITFVLLLILTAACGQQKKPGNRMVKQWETSPGLKTPESVLFDATTGIIYVSNVDGNPSAKDSTGFISTLSVDGKILKAGWVTGIDAPKGMGILNNHLFVSNIDEVVEIDITTATIVNRYPIKDSKFLNDIATDPKTGKIFITDSGSGQVYVLQNGQVSLWLQGPMFKGANGLFLNDSLLYIGTDIGIFQTKTDIEKVKLCVSNDNKGEVDGLFVTSEGKFIFSDWKGSVYIASLDGKPELLLNTSVQKNNAADFGIIASKKMILIPTFFDNKVVCYTLSEIE
jgi:DNA-binding beta-propeller fold protein YncE